MREDGTGHHACQQRSTNRGGPRNQQQGRRGYLNTPRKITKPLADSNPGEQIRPEDVVGAQLVRSEIQEYCCQKALQNPERKIQHSVPLNAHGHLSTGQFLPSLDPRSMRSTK